MRALKNMLAMTLMALTIGILQVQAQTDSTAFAWTPEKMIGLKRVSSPMVSPDGQYVAYTVRQTQVEGEKSDFLTQLWVMKSDGSMNRQFTRGEHSVYGIQFTPDGQDISFLSARHGDKAQLYRIYLNGGEAEQLTYAKNGINSYKWSPDGGRIAFTMTDPETKEEKKQKKEKKDVVLVDKDFKFSRLYVETMGEDSSTHSTTQLTTGNVQVSTFDWSPDGKRIVFSHQPTPKLDDGRKSNISLVPADSGAVKDLVTWPGADSSPHVSPDGKYIVFQSSGGREEPIGLTDIYRVSFKAGKPVALAQTPNRSASIVEWQPDGKNLLVRDVNHTYTSLYALPADGSAPKQITKEDGVYGGFNVSKDGRHLVFTFEQPETPPDIYISGLQTFNKKQLTHLYAKTDFPAMGKTKLIHWTSKDGKPVEGLLTYPVGFKKGDKVPLILNVHGGPGGAFSQSWTGSGSVYPIQYFANHGFAILRPNPRGSTGYGKDFRYANVQDWGFGDYQDLMTGVDKVIAMGVADPDKLVEMGWSYGGYMTSFIVTRTHRFKAVSMGAGLPDLISMVATTDIHSYLVGHMGGYYWDSEKEKDVYEKHSAIFHMKSISTPVQIIHGMEDHRVPTSQGKEFYWALKARGVPAEMVMYPRTPHGPREPKFIADVPHRIMKWFEKYLSE